MQVFKDLLKEGEITLEVYIEKILAFYDFYRKPILNNEEESELSDDLSSDSDSDSDNE